MSNPLVEKKEHDPGEAGYNGGGEGVQERRGKGREGGCQ